MDVLKPPSLLSKALQENSMDVVLCLQNILHAKKSLRSLIDVDPLEWPTVKLVHNRIADSEYQGTRLKRFNDTVLESCKDQALTDVSRLEDRMRERLEWSDIKLLHGLLIFLDTQTWRSVATDENDLEFVESSPGDKSLTEVSGAVELIATTFREPLEAVGVNLLVLQDQITEIVEYALSYLSIETEVYHKVWYKLHVCPDASRWKDILILCELCFSLPFSNGRVERIFSSLKLIKTDRRTRLHHDTLSDLLEIHVEGPALHDFTPKPAVEAWWSSCKTSRRPNQSSRKQYSPRSTGASTSTGVDEETEDRMSSDLIEWDSWLNFDNENDMDAEFESSSESSSESSESDD